MLLFICASVSVILIEKLKYIIDNYITNARNRNNIIYIMFAIYLIYICIYRYEIINYTNEIYLILIGLAASIYRFHSKVILFLRYYQYILYYVYSVH